jgi:disulfide bond formation protein DsbB
VSTKLKLIIIIIIIIIIMVVIGVALTGEINVIQKEAENVLKYEELTIEIERMWTVTTMTIPVIIGATGTISKSFRKYVSTIPGNHDVKELQKTAILGTAHTAESADVKVH